MPPPAAAGGVFRALDAVNARHPWDHNEHFHPWLLRRLPERRSLAVDVGCGQGALLPKLAPHFDRVLGTDTDGPMRSESARRTAALPNVDVADVALAELPDGVDLLTMVAVLHHLELEDAFRQVRRILAPGGRLLVVGLARPESATDHLWDAWSAGANPLIGLLKHPLPVTTGPAPAPYPVTEPTTTFAEMRRCAADLLPDAQIRRRIPFRYTLEWRQPTLS